MLLNANIDRNLFTQLTREAFYAFVHHRIKSSCNSKSFKTLFPLTQYRANNTPVTEPNLQFRCPQSKLHVFSFFHTDRKHTHNALCALFCLLFLILSPNCSSKINEDDSMCAMQISFSRTEKGGGKKSQAPNVMGEMGILSTWS